MTDPDFTIEDAKNVKYDVYRSNGEMFLSPDDYMHMSDREWEFHVVLADAMGENEVPMDPELGDFVGIRPAPWCDDLFAVGETVTGLEVIERTAPRLADVLGRVMTTIRDVFDAEVDRIAESLRQSVRDEAPVDVDGDLGVPDLGGYGGDTDAFTTDEDDA